MPAVVAETLKEKIPFEANTWKKIELPRYGCITEIALKVKLNVTAGTTVTPSGDAPYSVIKNINVVKGGTYPIQTTGHLLYLKNYYEYKGKIKTDTLPSAGGTKDVVFELVIHPGYNVYRKDDNSVAIDASKATTVLEILWGDNSDLGSGYTINSGEIEVTIWRLVAGRPRKEPAWEITTKSIDQTYSDLSLYVDLPEKLIPKAIIVVRDDTGARSDAVVTEIGLVKTLPRTTIVHRISYDAQKYDDTRRYSVDPIVGVVIFDAQEIGYLNIRGAKDLKLAFTTATTGSLTILFPSHP